MKRSLRTVVLVAALLALAALPVVGQTLSIDSTGGKYYYIGPSIIPVTDTGSPDVGVLRLELEEFAGADAYIGQIVLRAGAADTLGLLDTDDITNIQFYVTNRTDFDAWPVLNPPAATEITIDTITRHEGALEVPPVAYDFITLDITDADAVIPASSGNNLIYISMDYGPNVATGETVSYYFEEIRYGGAAGGTGTGYVPGLPSSSTRDSSAINDYIVTFGASGIVEAPAQVEEGTSDVQVLQIDLGADGPDEAVQKELESVTFTYDNVNADTADITTGNVRLHLDGNGNGAYDDEATDPLVGSATVSGSTVTVTTVPAAVLGDPNPNVEFSTTTRSYLLVVNVADRGGDGVGNVVTFGIANPSTDLTFRDEVDETVAVTNGATGEYDQAGYITDISVTITTNSFEILEKTVVDVTPPEVTDTSPANLATGVPRDAVISVTFSEPMATITEADVTVVGSSTGAIDLVADGTFNFTPTAFTFDLTGLYDYSETITVTVDGAVEDQYVADPNFLWEWLGVDPAADYSFSFTIEDPTPPEVTSTSPLADATGVLRDATVTIVFNEAMDLGTLIAGNFDMTDELAASVPGDFAVVGDRTITFDPTSLLEYETVYTVELTSANILDAEGTALSAWTGATHPYTFSFTTELATPPEVSDTTPNNGAIGVERDATVEIIFSEAMDLATLVEGNFSMEDALAAPVAGTFSVVGDRTINFVPDAILEYGTTYTVELVSANILDAEGTTLADWTGATHPYAFSFMTVLNTPPTVLASIPANESTDASVGTTVSVVFSEPMDETTVLNEANFSLVETGETAELTGTLSYTAEANTLSFVPDEPLRFSTSYTGTVTTGVTDADGTSIAADHSFSFTTASAAAALSFTDIIVTNNRIEPGSTEPMRIFLEVPEGANGTDAVTIAVYTANGRRVATLTTAGETYDDVIARQPLLFDGTNGRGQPLGPGLYFVQVSSNGYRRALRVMIVR